MTISFKNIFISFLSSEAFLSAIENMESLNSSQQSLMFDLIEHEAQHHGQLVRYLYAQTI